MRLILILALLLSGGANAVSLGKKISGAVIDVGIGIGIGTDLNSAPKSQRQQHGDDLDNSPSKSR